VGLLVINALVFTLWLILKWPSFDLYFFIVQGSTNLVLTIMYIVTFRQFCKYHAEILSKYDKVFSEMDKAQINNTTREVKTFFFNIQQMLIIQSTYLIAQVMKVNYPGEIWMERIFDIVNSTLMISYILMYVGISQSINRAFKAQYRKRLRTISKQHTSNL
jgi:hypothetical protein